MQQSLGFAHFLAQADGVATAILVIMLAMSVVTWYLIIILTMRNMSIRRAGRAFVVRFREASHLGAVSDWIGARYRSGGPIDEPFAALVRQALLAARHHRQRGAETLIDAGPGDDFLARAMRRSIGEAGARMESGLAVLASVGSSAPFIGLFGTVWGIYHALLAIGMSGQGTLDKVAGPVGEALIMTALGLAVAIPAVLAYNAFVRRNRVVLAELDAFAHDVFSFLATGHQPTGAMRVPTPDAALRAAPGVGMVGSAASSTAVTAGS